MGGTSFDLTGSRLQNATRVNQAAEDLDVIDWSADDEFIICAMMETTSHGGASGTLELRWRNVTDGGSFSTLSGTGELVFGSATDLTNFNAVSAGEEVCTPTSGTTRVDGKEFEGDSSGSLTLNQNEYAEFQYAVDPSNSLPEKQYEFEIYDATAGASVGTCLAQLTTITQDVTISAGVDPLTLTEYQASINAENNIGVIVASLGVFVDLVTITLDVEVDANVDTLTLTTYQSLVTAGVTVDASTHALNLVEYQASIALEYSVDANVDALTLTEYTATVELSNPIPLVQTLTLPDASALPFIYP